MTFAVIGVAEAVVAVVVIVLVFGASRLPKLARSVGQAGRELRKGFEEGAPEDEEERA